MKERVKRDKYIPHHKGGRLIEGESWAVVDTNNNKNIIVETFRTFNAAKSFVGKNRKSFFGQIKIIRSNLIK